MNGIFVRSAWPLFLFVMLAAVWCGPALAANCQSNASGNWSVPATWTSCGGGIPGNNDNVTIVSPHTVTLDVSSGQLRDVVVQAGATLIGNAGTVLRIGRTGGVNLTNNGTINFTAGATIAHVNNAVWTGNGAYNLYAIDLSNRAITFSGAVPTQINLNAPTPIVLGGASGLLTSNVATTWNFNGAAAQTLPTGQVTYGAMTINNPAGVTLGTALTATNILGNLSVQSGTLSNGGFAITLAANRDFSVTNGATFRMTGTTGMVTVSGTGTKTFGTTLPTCSTVDYAGSAQTVSNETYGNLTLSGSGVKTMPNTAMNVACDFSMSGTASATALAALTVGRNFTLNPGTSFTAGTFSHSVSGNFSNSGTFTANTSTFTFNGASTQGITGVTIFYNLTMNNAAGFTINDNVTAANVLTMTSGIVSTGANTLITTANCPASISRTSGHIAGNLRLTFPTTDPVTCTFHVGDTNNYAPITVTKTGANAGTLTGSSTAGDHADTTAGTSGINAAKSVNRYWTLTGGTLASGTPYSAIFQFCSATGTGCGVNDVDAGANTADFIVAKKTSGSWTLPTVGSKTSTTTQATGLSSFGDFAVGELGPDHYELSLPTSGITCLSSTATVTACADATSPCTNPFTAASGTTATLATSAGTLGLTTVTFNASGIASTTLSYPAAADGATATVTLSGESTAAANPRQCCPDGVSCVVANSCSTTFNTAGFIFSGSVGGGVATIPTQVAGTSSGTFYLRAVRTSTTTKACEAALAGANTVNFAYECNNPTTCYTTDLMSVNGGAATTIARNDNGSVSSYTSVNMTFDADGNAPFTFNYSDVGQVTLHVSKTVNSAPLTGSSNAFVVRPFGFTLSNIKRTSDDFANPGAADASGAIFIKAGDDFTATVRATTSGGAATPNYGRETTPEGVLLTPNLVAGLGLTANPSITNGSIAGGEFGAGGAVADSNGEATVTNLAWGEVGVITLTPSVADGDYLGVGDVTGTTTGNVGRFTPFDLNVAYNTPQFAPACVTGPTGFTYIGQKFNYATAPVITVTARNKAAATTQNYKGTSPAASAWFKITNADLTGKTYAAAVGVPNTSLIGSPDPVIADNGNGTGTLTFGSGGGIVFPRSTPVAPFDADIALSINVLDSDGIAFAGNPAVFGAATSGNGIAFVPVLGKAMRFGRLKLSNAYGSELINLPVSIETQYYNGTVFITNADDDCTTLVPNNLNLTTALTGVTATLGGAFVDGKGSLTLTKPSTAAKGAVDICVDLDVGVGVGDTTCQATTPADMTYLQGKWSGASYDKDPAVRGTFGLYKSPTEIIFIRENY